MISYLIVFIIFMFIVIGIPFLLAISHMGFKNYIEYFRIHLSFITNKTYKLEKTVRNNFLYNQSNIKLNRYHLLFFSVFKNKLYCKKTDNLISKPFIIHNSDVYQIPLKGEMSFNVVTRPNVIPCFIMHILINITHNYLIKKSDSFENAQGGFRNEIYSDVRSKKIKDIIS